MREKINDENVSHDVLAFYIPYYKMGEKALDDMIEDPTNDPHEMNERECQSRLKSLAILKMADLYGPIITNEIKKLINNSTIQSSTENYSALRIAAIDGLDRGLSRYDMKNIETSSPTNYLIQWASAYASRERDKLEMPIDMSVNAYRKFKKISAVRKKLKDEIGREPTNQEVLDFFHSGKADVKKSLGGRKNRQSSKNVSNQKITEKDIIEQKDFEERSRFLAKIDTSDSMSESFFKSEDTTPFGETIFGIFSKEYHIKNIASSVIASEMQSENMTDSQIALVKSLSNKEYKRYVTMWRNLLKDPDGKFYEFLSKTPNGLFPDFDVKKAMKYIENNKYNSNRNYDELFENGEQ